MRRFASISLALLCALVPARSRAFEREWHFGGGFGVTAYPHYYSAGPTLAAYGAYGLSDVFDARFEVMSSLHSYPDAGVANSRALPVSVSAGIAYKLDVLQWIPYAGLLIGYRHTSGTLPQPSPFPRDGIEGVLAFGLDYAVSRSFGLGAQVRSQTLLAAPSAGRSLAALLRAEYHFGF